MKMSARCLGLLVLCGVANAGEAELRYPPKPADKDAAMGWPAARDLLATSLREAYYPGLSGRVGSTGSPAYRQWLLLYKWADLLSRPEQGEATSLLARHLFRREGSERLVLLRSGQTPDPEWTRPSDEDLQSHAGALSELLPPGIPSPSEGAIADRLDPELLAAWFHDPEFLAMFFDNLSPGDYAPGVLWNLQEIAKAAPDKFQEYTALAMAIAMVYDARLPDDWPHTQVSKGLTPIAQVSPSATFEMWVTANEGSGMLNDLRSLTPDQLKFVVDAPLSSTEFEWARKNVRFSKMSFDRAFSSVRFTLSRIKEQKYDWTEGDYTLANIKLKGGICVDQAYFAMVAGKARGLPTLFFTGQGDDGGHAWFGYMKSTDRWDLDCGRYATQNYATGEALDPQTWLPISDHDLQSLSEGFRDRDEFLASMDDLRIAELFEAANDPDNAKNAFSSAVAVCPQNPAAWDGNGAFMARSGASAADRKTFHEAAYKQFLNRRDIRVRHQQALAGIARETGDTVTAEKIQRQIITQNRRLRSDLSVSAAARQLTALVDDGNMEGAMKEYRKMVSSLGSTGGGHLFYDIVRPFFTVLVEEGDTKRAGDALALARRALRPQAHSILSQEFAELEDSLKKPKP